jgi:general stress protein YciG
MTNLDHKEFSSRGGKKTFFKYGRKHFSEIGKKGMKTNIKLYGKEFFVKLSAAGVAARKAKRDAAKPLVEKIKDAILPNTSSNTAS